MTNLALIVIVYAYASADTLEAAKLTVEEAAEVKKIRFGVALLGE